jgi:hypothetical protein
VWGVAGSGNTSMWIASPLVPVMAAYGGSDAVVWYVIAEQATAWPHCGSRHSCQWSRQCAVTRIQCKHRCLCNGHGGVVGLLPRPQRCESAVRHDCADRIR